MPQSDFGINGRVRRVLARRWVRPETLEIGVTEGVVLLKGYLGLEPGGGVDLADECARTRFLQRLRGDLLGISGVTDVVMDLHNSEETAARWMRTGS